MGSVVTVFAVEEAASVEMIGRQWLQSKLAPARLIGCQWLQSKLAPARLIGC